MKEIPPILPETYIKGMLPFEYWEKQASKEAIKHALYWTDQGVIGGITIVPEHGEFVYIVNMHDHILPIWSSNYHCRMPEGTPFTEDYFTTIVELYNVEVHQIATPEEIEEYDRQHGITQDDNPSLTDKDNL